MSRSDIAVDISRRLKLPIAKASEFVDAFIESLTEALSRGERIEFRRFGVFEPVQRKPKIGRNPMDPAAGQYQIPARRVIKFRMGSVLNEHLNPE